MGFCWLQDQFRLYSCEIKNYTQSLYNFGQAQDLNYKQVKKADFLFFLYKLALKTNPKYKPVIVLTKKMPPSSSAQDLSQAMAALQKSLSILIVYYKGYIKFMLLVIFVYVFYRLGNMSIKDQKLYKKQELEELVERRVKVRVEIPKRLIKLRKLTFVILIATGLLLLVEALGYYMRIKWMKRNWGFILSIIISVSIALLTLIQLYKYFLQKKFGQNQSLERTISKNLAEFQTTLGPKVNKLLKHHLCKQQISKIHSSLYSTECIKPDCKQLRTAYKARVQTMQSLVNGVVDFEWCSTCRRRKGFDEYLGFEAKEYQDMGESEEEKIKYKTKYLLQGLQRMKHWMSVTAPCNCSKLYWAMSTDKVLQYKQRVKTIEGRIKMLETKGNY